MHDVDEGEPIRDKLRQTEKQITAKTCTESDRETDCDTELYTGHTQRPAATYRKTKAEKHIGMKDTREHRRDRDKKNNESPVQDKKGSDKRARTRVKYDQREKMAERHGGNERYDNNEQRTHVRQCLCPALWRRHPEPKRTLEQRNRLGGSRICQ